MTNRDSDSTMRTRGATLNRRTRTYWAVRRIADGEIMETHQVGLYAPELPHTEGTARNWVTNLRGYTVVRRDITTITEEWSEVVDD